ncbi:hypothetical protein B0J14DRAFT_335445 [Halenospora varia]|nr:hypothetical protein B0J14DRAFT_335445 [Halenospora varia]
MLKFCFNSPFGVLIILSTPTGVPSSPRLQLTFLVPIGPVSTVYSARKLSIWYRILGSNESYSKTRAHRAESPTRARMGSQLGSFRERREARKVEVAVADW